MKNMLLILLALIVMPAAIPVWAGDVPIAPATAKPSMQTAPGAETSVVIEFKGSAQSTSALTANLERQAVYKDAICSTAPVKKPGETAKITCIKADGALLAYLSRNAPADVQWSITRTPATAAGCPAGCSLMNCPPPAGPMRCCRVPGYTPC